MSRKTTYTRGEDMAIMAFRLFTDASLKEIGEAIGRPEGSVNTRMQRQAMRQNGWRRRFAEALGLDDSYLNP